MEILPGKSLGCEVSKDKKRAWAFGKGCIVSTLQLQVLYFYSPQSFEKVNWCLQGLEILRGILIYSRELVFQRKTIKLLGPNFKLLLADKALFTDMYNSAMWSFSVPAGHKKFTFYSVFRSFRSWIMKVELWLVGKVKDLKIIFNKKWARKFELSWDFRVF